MREMQYDYGDTITANLGGVWVNSNSPYGTTWPPPG